MITRFQEDINDGLLRFAFIAYFEAISFARAGAEACPYERLFKMCLATRQLNGFKLHRSSVRADTAVRPYEEILSRSQAFTIPAEQRDARWNVMRVGRKPKA
jgi:hypothetical protein